MIRRPTRRLPAIALAAAVAILPLAACSDTEEPVTEATTVLPTEETETQTETAAPSESSSPSSAMDAAGATELAEGDVSQDALSDKVGQDVIFMAEVAEILSPESLTVGGQEEGQEPALVVGADLPADVEAGETIQVRGTVENFVLAVVEGEVDADLDDEALAPYEGMPAIVAATAAR